MRSDETKKKVDIVKEKKRNISLVHFSQDDDIFPYMDDFEKELTLLSYLSYIRIYKMELSKVKHLNLNTILILIFLQMTEFP